MARKELRGAHRYKPGRDQFQLGWRSKGQFFSVPVCLMNLSVSGVLLRLEDGPRPEPGKILLLPHCGGQRWIQADLLESQPDEGGWMLRARLLESFPYEVFKAVVWGGDRPVDAGAAPAPGPAADVPSPVRVLRLEGDATAEPRAEAPHSPPESSLPSGFAQRHASGGIEIGLARRLRAEMPGLVETRRKSLPDLDRVEPIPWITISLFSALVALLVMAAVSRQYGSAGQLGDLLSLLR